MKKLFSVAVVLVLLAVTVQAQSKKVSLPLRQGLGSTSYATTFANSQIDTLVITREAGIASYGFAATWKDSVNLYATASIVKKYMVDGVLCTYPATTDSVSGSGDFNSATDAGTSFTSGVALTSTTNWDQLWVIVKYAAAGNGVTSPNVVYTIYKTFYSK